MSIMKQLLLATAGAALVIFPIIGKAQPSTALTISFENDTDGINPNGFVSVMHPARHPERNNHQQ